MVQKNKMMAHVHFTSDYFIDPLSSRDFIKILDTIF